MPTTRGWRRRRPGAGLNASSTAGLLLVQGDESALAALIARLESLGIVGPVVVEVVGTQDEADEMVEFINRRTNDATVVVISVQPPPAS